MQETATTQKPSQCPHIQLMDPDLFQGGPPRSIYRELRENNPVCWLDDPYSDTGYWAVTRQADLDHVSKNPRIFSSAKKTPILKELSEEEVENQKSIMLNMDPPQHIKYRRIVRNAFTPGAVDSYEPHFRSIAEDIVKRALPGGKCEFVGDIASELPLIAICEILGVPLSDRQTFFQWSNTLIGDDDPEYFQSEEVRLNASAGLWAYADKLRETYKDSPERKGQDIVGTLLHGTVDGERLSEDEFRNFMLLLIVAGNETTRNQTSQLMRLLMENPEQYQLLVDNPALIPDAVEEALRYNSPVIAFRRTAMQDTELGGEQIRKGDKIVLFYQSASSDEANFQDPDKFDITRPQREPVREQLRAFGIGEHFCLGSHLARLELRLIFEQIVSHIRNPRLDGEVSWLRSHFINGIKHMPIVFDTA